MVHISKIDIWRISTWAHWQLQNIWQLKLTRKSSLVHLTTLRICIWAHWQPQIMYLSSLTASRMCETSSLCFSRSFSTDFRVPITCIQHYKDYVWYEYIFHQNYFAIEISDFLIVKNLRWKLVKENKKTRTRSRKWSRKKVFSYFLDRFLGRVLVFLFCYFFVFFFKFPPLHAAYMLQVWKIFKKGQTVSMDDVREEVGYRYAT